MKEIKKIAIAGAGQMGLGIAELCGNFGYQVQVFDNNQQTLSSAFPRLEKSLQKLIEKGKISKDDSNEILGRIKTSGQISELNEADLVIEAIVESYEIKSSLFKSLSETIPSSTLIASNTSSLCITRLANSVSLPERFIGIHFFNPAPVMPLVEIISGLKTNESTKSSVLSFIKKLDKEIVEAKDSPGFIVNRILCPMINEAIFLLAEGNKAEEIDKALKLGANHPMGPLQLADFVGLDTLLRILEIYQQEFGEDKYRPSPLLRQYVDAGWLGKKTRKGFYDYSKI